MKQQINELKEKAEEGVKALAQGGTNRVTTAVHFTACLWRAISYPLPVMNMTKTESETLERALYSGTINNLGLTS
eukprot:13730918-Ditylum_brightwellii.AAC.1